MLLPGRLPADRSWGSVGAGRLGAGDAGAGAGAGAPAALRGAGGCSAPESCGRRGRTSPPRGTCPRTGARAVQRGASSRQRAGAREADPAPHGRRTKARPERAALAVGSGLAELSPGRSRGGSRRFGQSPVGSDGPAKRGRSLPLICSLGSVRLCYGQVLTRGLSKREDYLKVHQLLVQEGN